MKYTPLLILALLLCLPVLHACQAVGAIAAKTPQEEPAEYILAEVPTLVLVEDRENRMRYAKMPHHIAHNIEKELLAYQAIPEELLIDRAKLNALKSEPGFKDWSVATIGEKAGAQQVVFVSITYFKMQEAELVYRPEVKANVRVIDIKDKKMTFPTDSTSSGRIVEARLFYEQENVGRKGQQYELTRDVSIKLSKNIGNLFHPWIIPYRGDRSDQASDLKR